jgi:hypothetical protein
VTRSTIAAAALAATAIALGSGSAGAFIVDFETVTFGQEMVHGTKVDGSYTLTDSNVGIDIATENGRDGAPDFSVVFDTSETGTRDNDLEYPFGTPDVSTLADGGWGIESIGDFNGNILIVQENDWGCDDGVCNYPDDEGGGPNTISFTFGDPITAKSLDLFDIDLDETATLRFLDGSGDLVDAITVNGSEVGGNDHAGRVRFTNQSNPDGIENVTTILAEFSSSGATGNLAYDFDGPDTANISEPGSLALLATGAFGLFALRRRYRR